MLKFSQDVLFDGYHIFWLLVALITYLVVRRAVGVPKPMTLKKTPREKNNESDTPGK